MNRVRHAAILSPLAELALVERTLRQCRTGQHCYLAEISGDNILIHMGDTHIDILCAINVRFSVSGLEEYAVCHANYGPVMRFVLQEEAEALFSQERYCFRGSVEGWISIGPTDQLRELAANYLSGWPL